jgi:hypothetical protein
VAGKSPFLETFGLLDNPFNPSSFAGVSSLKLDQLSSEPLPLDEEPGLAPLFIQEAGAFESLLDRFDRTLRSKGYSWPPEPSLGSNSLLIRITGNKGTGKTTLANEMVRRVKECAEDATAQIAVHRISGKEVTAEDIKEEITVLGNYLNANGTLPCVILDDIPYSSRKLADELYKNVRAHTHMVLILILSDMESLRNQPKPGVVKVGDQLWNDYSTQNLTVNQATSLVAQRIKLFRADAVHGHFCGLGMDLFPFDPDDIASSVAPESGDRDEPGTIPLRLLNWLLDMALQQSIDKFPPGDITKLKPHELGPRLVKLEQAYLLYLDSLEVAA